MCLQKGVQLMHSLPYLLDLNPITKFFAELKVFIQQNWKSYKDHPDQGFDYLLQRCVDIVGAKKRNVEGHFWNTGLRIEA